MPLNEADTRAKLIDPALRVRGWTEDLVFREQTAGSIVLDGLRARRLAGRMDYLLRVRVNPGTQPVPLALIEAKAETRPPGHGMEQARNYARRFNVPFVFSSNGHQFVFYDSTTGLTSDAAPIADFPEPEQLRLKWQAATRVNLASPAARALLTPYRGGEGTRRYYQDAAIRAVFEKVARGEKRALLTLATGAGKTFIAANMLRRLFDAGMARRALFVCDRDELRTQATTALSNLFGGEAAKVARDPEGSNAAKNARVHVATYQSLGVDGEEKEEISFLTKNYPPNYFDVIVIDECHRSAWGSWSEVLTRNGAALQIGLTATPRALDLPESVKQEKGAQEDEKITADNIGYFGEPAYSYDISQAVEDGYLAVCEIVRRDVFLQSKTANERETGLDAADLVNVVDPVTGQPGFAEDDAHYEAESFEADIVLPERTKAMAEDLFHHLLATGGPHQKTIVFCVRDLHAEHVATAMNNLYAAWRQAQGANAGVRADPYAFKCTAESGGAAMIADFKGAEHAYFIASTVDLLSTGVDVPDVRNIVFFRYLSSPIAFYQMVGRGTRLAPEKLMFRVYDYTDASRLFGAAFLAKARSVTEPSPVDEGDDDEEPDAGLLQGDGVTVRIVGAGRYVLDSEGGVDRPVPIEEYRARIAERLAAEAPTLQDFRDRWVDPEARRELLAALPEGQTGAIKLRLVQRMGDYDLFDVLGAAAYGLDPKSRRARAEAFGYKARDWLDSLPPAASGVLRAVVGQFGGGGTEALENPTIFQLPAVIAAGGVAALRSAGDPRGMVTDAKRRMFEP
jgi:type I restriction enzyme R subunit